MKERLDSLINQMVDSGVFFQDAVAELEKGFLKRVLEITGGNQLKAAKMLGIHRNTLSRKIVDYRLGSIDNRRITSKHKQKERL